MQETVCCVCQTPVGAGASTLGRRYYCDLHYERVTRDRRGLWLSTLVGIVALLIFVALVVLLVNATGPVLSGLPLLLAGIGLVLVPVLLWLGIFYRLDRLEPEPKHYVLGIFILGALLAQAVSIPALRDLFQVQEWLRSSGTAVNLAGSILVVGFLQEYLKYAGIRYTIYNSPEFDERVDGILYGVAIGLGFAFMLNLYYVLDSGGVRLDIGVMRIAIATLAQASFAGVSGYFLGRAKFEELPAWWLPAGVTLAAVLNGIVNFVLNALSVQGLQFTPAYALLMAAGVAGATFALLFTVIRRDNARTLARAV